MNGLIQGRSQLNHRISITVTTSPSTRQQRRTDIIQYNKLTEPKPWYSMSNERLSWPEQYEGNYVSKKRMVRHGTQTRYVWIKSPALQSLENYMDQHVSSMLCVGNEEINLPVTSAPPPGVHLENWASKLLPETAPISHR